jgi:hypothetical protein
MAIQVTCVGCKTRFKVSEQFAGRKGPCPKCKAIIQIPTKDQEVVIHGSPGGAAVEGGKTAGGYRAIPQPIFREDKGVSPLAIGIGVGSFLAILVGALVLRFVVLEMALDSRGREIGLTFPSLVALAIGAFVVAIPTSYYGFRALETADIEKMPVREALLRSLVCAACYAALWGLVWVFKVFVFEHGPTNPLALYEIAIYAPVMILIAGVAAMASFNLDYVKGLLHGGLYVALCVALRLIMGLDAF